MQRSASAARLARRPGQRALPLGLSAVVTAALALLAVSVRPAEARRRKKALRPVPAAPASVDASEGDVTSDPASPLPAPAPPTPPSPPPSADAVAPHAAPAALKNEEPDESETAEAPARPTWLWRASPAIPAPALRGLVPSTRLYLDGSVVRSRDLSALPYIAGSGINARTAFGGSWHSGGLELSGEITFAQATRIEVTQVPGGMPIPEDQTQTATSLGDSYLGLSYTHAFEEWPVAIGASLRGRIPTHTTIFQFHLIDGSLGRYPFPYYFHIEPALLLAGGWGPVSLVINEGPLVLLGPDGNFNELHIVVPTLWFWDSHAALAVALGETLGLSVELVTTFLTSHIDQPEFADLNGLVGVSLNPAISLRFERFQADLVGRWGLNKGAEAFGVITFAGTQGLLLRLSLFFP
jgi:hypothetical protein